MGQQHDGPVRRRLGLAALAAIVVSAVTVTTLHLRSGSFQDGILRDGVVTAEEYRAAFDRFVTCSPDGSIEQIETDPDTGVISYTFSNAVLAAVDRCYSQVFGRVDAAFQTTRGNG